MPKGIEANMATRRIIEAEVHAWADKHKRGETTPPSPWIS